MIRQKNFILQCILFIVPAFAVYTLIRIAPLLMSFGYSFTNWDGYAPAFQFVGLKNYIAIFQDDAILQSFRNTFVFAFFNTLLITLIAIPLALVLNSALKSTNLLRAVFFFPSVPSVLIIGYIWLFILDPTRNGVLNKLLFGIGLQKVDWLSDYKLAMVSLIMVSVWRLAGWHSCIYIANLQGISKDYYEAANIDGANRWQQFRYITFPLLAPAMTISVMLTTIDSLKVFELPFALTKGGPGNATTLLTQIIIERGINDKLVGRSSAMAVLFILIIFVIAGIQHIIMRRREERME
ncbi:carbohydrate ABC transporter permease [Paenibacillus piri]|uniref:carbohydrate ABC transporter permease n=1 Tax=Paenibacillus piri TaxID=2547395 RepID=UPI001FED09B0|nr:sugar ABC transporter permease [Paenibacillus piri]